MLTDMLIWVHPHSRVSNPMLTSDRLSQHRTQRPQTHPQILGPPRSMTTKCPRLKTKMILNQVLSHGLAPLVLPSVLRVAARRQRDLRQNAHHQLQSNIPGDELIRTTRGTAPALPTGHSPSHFRSDTGDMQSAFGMICLRTSAAGPNVRPAAHAATDTLADTDMVVRRRRSSPARRCSCSASFSCSSCAVCLSALWCREREWRRDLELGDRGEKNERESGERGDRGDRNVGMVSRIAAGAVFCWRTGATA